jgi:hypothetical protein
VSNPITIIRRKRALKRWATAEKRPIPRGFRLTPHMGKPAKALLATFQRAHKLAGTGTWNAPSIAAIQRWYPKPAFGQAAVKAARSQLGVHEVGVNAGAALAKFYAVGWGGQPNPYGWCTWFAAWCWQEALKARGSQVKLGHQLASVYMPNTGAVLAAAKKGTPHLRLVTKPQAGDWVCMFGGKHSGIYERRSALPGYEVHIEGNTSPDSGGSQWNGGGVYRKTRSRSRDVDGYVRYVA